MPAEGVRALGADDRIQTVPRQVSAEVHGETVILQVETGRYYGLDEVGSRVWNMLDQPRTPREIADRLVEEFDVDRERCEADLDDLLRGFLERKLIQFVDQ
ncbi:MAG TPA: PqqD family protein [Longimicrobiaceae bacterium]